MKFDSVESVLDDVRAGKPIVLVDDKDRENEGDLMIAGELATPQSINFMAQHGKGLICLSLSRSRLQQLSIPLQVTDNTAPLGTNFTVSIDHRDFSGNGISAEARAHTIREASLPRATAEEFVSPGFVFPLAAVPGGCLERSGQTEGSVDLARLAGLQPAGVICEIMAGTGEMIRGAALEKYCREFQLKVTSVAEVAKYRLQNELSLRRVAEANITDLAAFGIDVPLPRETLEDRKLRICAYVDDADGKEHLAVVVGEPQNAALVRIHSECLTGDVFGSLRCDCGVQFQSALTMILQAGSGVLVYLYQEGRGIGLGNKVRAYELQDQGKDTVDANVELGFAADQRDYRAGAQILKDLGILSVKLITNNPQKLDSLPRFGIAVTERIALTPLVDDSNRAYLRAKRDRLGHLLPPL